MRRLCVLFVISFLFAPCVCINAEDKPAETGITLPERKNFHLFLLVGQSNMAGRGKVEAEDLEPHSHVLMFNQEEHWVPAVDPLHFDKPSVVGVGLGKTFGIEIANSDPEIVIGLIPCAAGGSPIETWEPGARHDQTNSHPWDDAIARAKKALPDGTLKGILWHQGESDSNSAKAPIYEEKLLQLIARFRTELNAFEVPFIVGQMGIFPERPWSEARKQVDLCHQTLPEKVYLAGFVSAAGLTHKGDNVHFDSSSYRELGRRYAQVYLQLAEQVKTSDAQFETQFNSLYGN
ncbi:MAG: sialate O-acetylesterase [Planctomycetaceae bacterium]|nr:sialate O-acetylesterase [Planctomycetaceae bacterium]